uniref:Uncharacterized protein n=1 Tax=Chromera velia CCMP2878 TaxID=1169474 RepID=A0A0G4FHE5_9ALVE|eukprot:Cvel_16867.t1-p1 / transcript=Cvel_16867.t1 / gene=Cvel_16867 / organism=Chromera_velia_CCMP2878 / gene_product=Putative ankyrin repeat protein RF_0381, putative / transcript_product=Putative ankyrin repeat protein RF_0381, putative / location=Cvel_scaffold1319:45163-46614(-) / protein_length=484 / sequence_SO=supercontig / SO=protein_coding / is_pseudo=false
MEETAASPPPITEFLHRLDEWEASLVSSLHARVALVKNILESKQASQAAPAGLSRVRPEDVLLLDCLDEEGKELLEKAKKNLDAVVSGHFCIDVGHLFAIGVGEVISFLRSVSAETLQKCLSDFVAEPSESKRDDLCLCLKVGADVDGLVDGQTALMRAVAVDNEDAAQMIRESGADLEVRADSESQGCLPGDTVVITACRQHRWKIVRYLVAEGADVNAVDTKGRKALQVACEAAESQLDPPIDSNDEEERLHRLQDEDNRLFYDPQNGDAEVRSAVSEALKDLMQKTSAASELRIRARNRYRALQNPRSLIHFFAWYGLAELVSLAVLQGVDIDTVVEESPGFAPLHECARRAKPDFVKCLIENGAEVDKRTAAPYSHTALTLSLCRIPHLADERFFEQPGTEETIIRVVEILLDHGADLNVRTFQGNTPLHWVVKTGLPEVVKFLVDKSANLQTQNDNGDTPHAFAVKLSKSDRVLRLLTS